MVWSLAGHAFNADGHRLVVQLAQFRLNEDSRRALAELYGERWPREMTELADWAHDHRPEPEWRTVLFDAGDSGFEASRHCPHNRCVVAAVLESQYVLSNSGFQPQAKREAVQYLMHFITDLHVPINAGRRADRAGRAITLQTSRLNKVDLHWVWNEGLFQTLDDTWFNQAQRYRRNLSDRQAERWAQSLKPVAWALESHRLALEVAYPLAERGQYDAIYIHRALPVLEAQLIKAGVRLAALLNEAFAASASGGGK